MTTAPQAEPHSVASETPRHLAPYFQDSDLIRNQLEPQLAPLGPLFAQDFQLDTASLESRWGYYIDVTHSLPPGVHYVGWWRRGKKVDEHGWSVGNRRRLLAPSHRLMVSRHPLNLARCVFHKPGGTKKPPVDHDPRRLPVYDITSYDEFSDCFFKAVRPLLEPLSEEIKTACRVGVYYGVTAVYGLQLPSPAQAHTWSPTVCRTTGEHRVSSDERGPLGQARFERLSKTLAREMYGGMMSNLHNSRAHISERSFARRYDRSSGRTAMLDVPPTALEELLFPRQSEMLKDRLSSGISAEEAIKRMGK
jgi:hypothetical protein